MTLFEVEELCRYWAEYPPLHVTAAAILGHGRRRRSGSEQGSLEAIAADLGVGFAVGDVNAGMPPAILTFERLRATVA